MPNKKSAFHPSVASKPRRLCSVCGTPSYSRDGIHPQCAQQQADAARMKRVKPRKKPAASRPANAEVLKPWHKRCPKCRVQVHVRKPACPCGFQFPKLAGSR